jgi:L-asparagine transporter-like permease
MKNTILSKLIYIKSNKKNYTLKLIDIFQIVVSIILIVFLSILAFLTLDNNSKILLNVTSIICLIIFYDGYTNLNKNKPHKVEKLSFMLNKTYRVGILHS